MNNTPKFEAKNPVTIVQNDENKSITLPINEEDFKKFISGLLGKPQTIDATIETEFELKLNDIKHIYYTLQQRITQQNGGYLIAFNARLVFSDKTSVLLNSIEDLVSYSEIKPVICEGLHLTFQYLITFSDKDVPERQEINLTFITNAVNHKGFNNFVYFLLNDKEDKNKIGTIQYNIKHTARTFGADIDSLFSNILSSVKKPENKALFFLRKQIKIANSWIHTILLIFFCYFAVTSILNDVKNRKLNTTEIVTAIFNNQSNSYSDIDEKLKSLVNLYENPQFVLDVPYKIYLLIVFLVLYICISLIFTSIIKNNFKYSHILLTEESIKFKELSEKKYNKRWIFFFIALSTSVFTSLTARIIFEAFLKRFF